MTAASSLERILDILLAFADRPEGITMQELASSIAMSRSSVYRYVQILKSRGMVEETPVPGLLRVGPAVHKLARARGPRMSLAEIAGPAMRDLAAATGESVLLTRREGDAVAIIAAVDSPQMVSVRIEAALNSPLHVGSFGKLHLAHLSEEDIAAFLSVPRFAATTGEPVDPAALLEEIAIVRRRGFAVSENEVEFGMKSISLPILSARGTLVAALTVAGPTFRFRRLNPETVQAQIRRAIDRIGEDWRSEAALFGDAGEAFATA